MSKNDDKTTIVETSVNSIDVEPCDDTSVSEVNLVSNEVPVAESIYYDTLVLSGGSAKGIIILGAVQYIYDNYLVRNIQTYIGTSAGSMICFLLAIGYTPIEIMVYICTHQLMEKMQHFNLVSMMQLNGAYSYNSIQEQLEKMTISKIGYLPTLRDLKTRFDKTLVCVTHNLTKKTTEYLSWQTHPELPCLTAIRMSSNLPLIFETYQYNNCMYIDGGISDNFAIDIGEKMGIKVIGIILEPSEQDFNNSVDTNVLEFIYKLMFIPITQAMENKIQTVSDKCRIIRIEHEGDVKFFQFNIDSRSKLNMFSVGYQKMKEEFS